MAKPRGEGDAPREYVSLGVIDLVAGLDPGQLDGVTIDQLIGRDVEIEVGLGRSYNGASAVRPLRSASIALAPSVV